jgi:hypothetical protein
MKKILLVIAIIFLIGCSNNKQVKLIEAFVCTTDGVRSDLSFKMIKLAEISPITVIDSMFFFFLDTMSTRIVWTTDSVELFFQTKYGKVDTTVAKTFIDTIGRVIDKDIVVWTKMRDDTKNSLVENKAKLKEQEFKSNNYVTKIMTEMYQSLVESNENSLSGIEDQLANLAEAKKYSKIPLNNTLLRAFDCIYSIINPILKVKQTQTQTFYFNLDLTKVIASSGIKK